MRYLWSLIGYNCGGPIQVEPTANDQAWISRFDFIIEPNLAPKTNYSLSTTMVLADFTNAVVRDGVPVDEFRAVVADDEKTVRSK